MNEPKLPPQKPESPEETRLRIDAEVRCRKIGDAIKGMLPKSTGFVLVTRSFGAPSERFKSTQYVASVNRDDAERLLNELLDYWRNGDLRFSEPTVKTATFLRESVHTVITSRRTPTDMIAELLAEATGAAQAFPDEAFATTHTEEECRDAAQECVTHAMTAAVIALALFQSFSMMAHQLDRARQQAETAS